LNFLDAELLKMLQTFADLVRDLFQSTKTAVSMTKKTILQQAETLSMTQAMVLHKIYI
jgi:hypothetical protein